MERDIVCHWLKQEDAGLQSRVQSFSIAAHSRHAQVPNLIHTGLDRGEGDAGRIEKKGQNSLEVQLPFGVVKGRGNRHREGFGAIDFFTTWKAVYVDCTDKLQRAQIDNLE